MRKAGLVALALAGSLLAGPAVAAELKIGLAEDPDMLDPAQSRTFVGRIVYTAMCDKLVDVTPKLEIVPQLATEWAWSEDGKVLTMKLRPGVKFHDGTVMDSAAVVATLERNMTAPESRRKSEISSIAKVEASGPLEIRITLKQPDATLLAQFSDRAGMIVSPKAVAELGANFSSHPVCAGPFEFVERIQQDRIVLKKFADYWNKDQIHFDKVTYLPIVDSTVRLANLRAGDLDMIERMAPTDLPTVKADAKLAHDQVVNLGFLSIYVNVGHGPRADNPFGKDKRVRQAFSLAIDREALNQIVYEGTAPAGNQPFAPSSPWYNAKIPVPARDLVKAKALLKEAGYDRVPVEMLISNQPIVGQMMQAVQAMTAEAGFDVTLKTTEFATLLNEETAGNFQMARTDWSGRVDPDGNIHQFVTCNAALNEVKYCNPKVDALLNEARASVDTKVRKEKYDAATAILDDDLPYIYLAHQSWLWGFTKKLTGFVPSPDGMIRLTGLTKAP